MAAAPRALGGRPALLRSARALAAVLAGAARCGGWGDGRAEVVEHDIWDSFGPGFCRSRDRCACAPRSPKDCAVTARGGAGSWSREGARCRVAGADVAREAGGCGELCARDPTCHFAYADWDGCLLYRACDLSRAPDRQGANLIRHAADGGHVIQFDIRDAFPSGFCRDAERCTCAELPSGSDCAASVAGQPGHAPGTCRLGDLHALEDCRESCVADLTCRFAYFERGGCHMYRSCISSRVPANAGTNMRRVPDLGAAQVERHDIFLTTGHGFCEPGRLCTCAESAEVCAESLRAHPHGVPPGTCLRAGVRALEDCQQMCAADPSCWFAYFEQGGCHLYESCEKSRVPMHDGVNLRRLPPAEAGEASARRGRPGHGSRSPGRGQTLAASPDGGDPRGGVPRGGVPLAARGGAEGGWLPWRLLPWGALAAALACAARSGKLPAAGPLAGPLAAALVRRAGRPGEAAKAVELSAAGAHEAYRYGAPG